MLSELQRALNRLATIGLEHGRVLRILVVGIVPAGTIEIELANLRRHHHVIAELDHLLGEVLLNLRTDDSALGHPKRKTGAHLLAGREQVEFPSDDTVIATFGLFQPPQVLIQRGLLEERRAVDSLQRAIVDVTAIV